MRKSTTSTAQRKDEEIEQLRRRVAELEQALERQQEAEQRLSQQLTALHEQVDLLDVTHDALLVRDLEGTIIFWNRTAEKIYGWSSEEATGEQTHTLLQTDFPADAAAIDRQLLQDEEWSGELTQISRDGSTLIVSSHWQLRRHVWGRPAVVIEVNQDVTERKRTETDLRDSEAELRALFAAITDVILVLDRDGYYRKVAPTDPRQLHIPPEQMVGKRLHEILPTAQADFFLTIVRRALESGQVVHIEYPMQVGDLSFWFSGAVSPMSDDVVIWIARDITDRKRIEQEQARLREQIIRTQAAMLAELSTPLISLNDQVLVMPIIGMIDQQRSQAILNALLEGVSSQRASAVIVDINGVPQIDSHVAQSLVHAAQQLRKEGAQMILTGMRADVAQTLNTLGIDLGEIVMRSTLQSGIAYALNLHGPRNQW